MICDNIYGEMPFMDASSRYVIYFRLLAAPTKDRAERRNVELWRADLTTRTTERVDTGVYAMKGMGISPDLRTFYCVSSDDDRPTHMREMSHLKRLDIVTLQRKSVPLSGPGRRFTTLGAISRDGMYYVGAFLGPQRYGIVRIHPDTGEIKIIHESNAEIFNAHTQIEPGQGKRLLIQHNRGAQVDDDGNVKKSFGKMGTTLYTIDLNGGDRQPLNVGRPFTPTIQGHEAWIGYTGNILFTTHWQSPKLRAERGNIWMIRPGDEKPRPVARGFTFWHCGTSRCGKYFIADTVQGAVVPNPDPDKAENEPYVVTPMPKRGLIVVGCIATGKTQVLCEATADVSGGQYRHPHPYLSPDSKWAIFSTEKDGVSHVAAARIPDGLLEKLAKP
jgi:sugar lactone lactonase YvrE